MSGLFKPKMPKIEPTAPPPTVDEAQVRRNELDRMRRRRGRASTILTDEGGQSTGSVGVNRLLGGG